MYFALEIFSLGVDNFYTTFSSRRSLVFVSPSSAWETGRLFQDLGLEKRFFNQGLNAPNARLLETKKVDKEESKLKSSISSWEDSPWTLAQWSERLALTLA